MNRYQQEVLKMDRRHRQVVRSLSFAGIALLAAIGLWSVYPHVSYWWASAHQSSLRKEAIERIEPTTSLTASAPDSVRGDAVRIRTRDGTGTDSSISAHPQPLYLIATAPGRNRHEGTARIGTSPDNPQTYVAGALLVNGARIAEIHHDHVVLERDRERRELYLRPLAANTQQPVDDLLTSGGTPRATAVPPVTREILTDYMRPSPVFADDVLSGYQVYPGRKAGVFSQLGLRPGDVITSINDAPILDTAIAIEVLKEITTGSIVVVSVERNNKTQRLMLDGTLIKKDLESEVSQ